MSEKRKGETTVQSKGTHPSLGFLVKATLPRDKYLMPSDAGSLSRMIVLDRAHSCHALAPIARCLPRANICCFLFPERFSQAGILISIHGDRSPCNISISRPRDAQNNAGVNVIRFPPRVGADRRRRRGTNFYAPEE